MAAVNTVIHDRVLQNAGNCCEMASKEVPCSMEVVTRFFNDALGGSRY